MDAAHTTEATMTTATEKAIERSISHTEIVTLDEWTEADRAALVAAADDYADAGRVEEFWGARNGDEWRVHLRRA